jgi:hypothetical protein
MKYFFFITALLLAFNLKGQTKSVNNSCDLEINGSWILSHIDYEFANCKEDVLNDSIIKLVISDDSIIIYELHRFYGDTSYYKYENQDESITLINSGRKKKYQKTKLKFSQTTKFDLILTPNSFVRNDPFSPSSYKNYHFLRILDNDYMKGKNNFIGKWFLKDFHGKDILDNDTILLTRDSCSYKTNNFNYIQYIELNDLKDLYYSFSFEKSCLDCFSGVYTPNPNFSYWEIDFYENVIIFCFGNKKEEFNYQLKKNELLLIKK